MHTVSTDEDGGVYGLRRFFWDSGSRTGTREGIIPLADLRGHDTREASGGGTRGEV